VTTRSYRQHCGLARALDVLGERWSLLIVRELTFGPKRYRDLADNLPGLGTNLLAARLRTLESAGVVGKGVLPPPANVQVYELTPRGEQLRPMLEDLALWGFQLLPDDGGDDLARAAWAALSMCAVMDREGSGDVRGTFAFEVEDERFYLSLTAGEPRVRNGVPPDPPDVRVVTDLPTFFALAARRLTPAKALRDDLLAVDGDRRRLDALLAVFHLPARAPA